MSSAKVCSSGFAWLYIFCREKLFRDDTKRIVAGTLARKQSPKRNKIDRTRVRARVLFLSAGRPVSTIIRARRRQLEEAIKLGSRKVRAQDLTNCSFERVNVLALSYDAESFDHLIASRLLTILPAREKAVAEMFRILRPGGKCFVAEPRYTFWASLPLFAMWMLASVTRYENGYREPRKASVLSQAAFKRLFATQPWKDVRTWQDGRYQYALCEKG